MDVDLIGKTVTQAMQQLESVLASAQGQTIRLCTDNEVVKLNLYNRLVKAGLTCKLERKGAHHFLTATLPKPVKQDKGIAYEPPPWQKHRQGTSEPESPTSSRMNRAAIPSRTAEMRRSGQVSPPTARPHPAPQPTPRPSAAPQPAPRPSAAPQPAPRPSAAPSGVAPSPASTAPRPTRSAASGGLSSPRWLVLSCDQIGQRDVSFGVDLLEELLRTAHKSNLEGVFLLHRGARLADPNYEGGRVLALLLGLRVKIRVCAKSANFYQVQAKLRPPIEVAVFDGWLLDVGIENTIWV